MTHLTLDDLAILRHAQARADRELTRTVDMVRESSERHIQLLANAQAAAHEAHACCDRLLAVMAKDPRR